MTGGQYTVFRVVSGLLLVPVLLRAPLPIAAAALAADALFIAGLFHRVAAVALAFAVGALAPGAPSEGRLLAMLALSLHAALPPKPYGTLAMRGDTDPGSTWRFPPVALPPLWVALGLALAAGMHPVLGAVPLLALMPRIRPVAWVALLAAGAARMTLTGPGDVPGFWMTLMLTFEPELVKPPPRAGEGDEIVFYDGACGLCHGFIRFLLSEDVNGTFKFAPLQSDTFTSRVPEALRQTLPDSIVLLTSDGRVLTRSAAVVHQLQRLPGLWALAGRVGAVLPKRPLDALYDQVAAVRHRFFKRPTEACPLMPKELRARFLY